MNKETYLHAWLADASYVNLSSSGVTRALSDRLSETEAAKLLADFEIHQWTDDETGLSATIFKDKTSGATTLAIRGTDNLPDYVVNGVLALGASPALNAQFVLLQQKIAQWSSPTPGANPGDPEIAPLLPQTFTVTGHSLGGYLAAAVKEAHPSRVSQAYLFNAPGVGSVFGSVASLFQQAFGTAPPGTAGVYNIRGSEGASFIAGLGYHVSSPIWVQTEPPGTNPLPSHFMQPLRQAIAVEAAFAAVLPSLTREQLTRCIDSFGRSSERCLEDAVEFLAAAVGSPLAVGTGDVNQLMDAVYSVFLYTGSQLSAVVMQDLPSSQWALLAQQSDAQGAAVRHALSKLSPLALVGGQYPADAETQDRSPEYWQARAALLERKLWFSENDLNPALPAGSDAQHEFQTENAYFQDVDAGYTVSQAGMLNSTTRYIFAGDAGGTLSGAGVGDFLFGAKGDDTLSGLYGSDRLEGYGGNDVLDGGAGADKLYGGSGDDWLGYTAANLNAGSADELDGDGNFYHAGTGNDRVYGSKAADTFWFEAGDEQDVIRGNGGADELWYAAEGQAPVISREGKNLVLTGQGLDRIVLEDWYADDEASASRLERLVLTRKPAQGQAPEEIGVVSGAYLHQRGLTKSGSGEIRGDLDRYQETLVGSDAVDFIYASQSHDGIHGGDILVGGKGDDFLYGSIGADKVRVSAGDGKEVYRGLGGADIVEFHGGLDIDSPAVLIDRVMNDLRITFEDGTAITIKDWDEEGPLMAFRNGTDGPLVGYSEMSLRVKRFFGDGNDNYYVVTTPTSQKVYGSGGNDTLLGSEADDLLDGGNGNDIVFAGAGNDQLWGQAGNDRLYGGTGNDNLYGNAGQDALWGEAGNDLLVGGDDDDHLWGGAGQDTLWGGAGSDTLEGGDDNDWLYAEAGNDVLKGGAGSNIMTGGAGNDTFHAEGSRDEMWGGGDFDTYILTPTGAGTQKLIFEDAQGGLVDLSAYAQAGVGIHLLRSAADQLILTSSQGETIVVNGWAHQSTSLLVGSQTWDYARVQNALSEKYGYTYDNVWRAAEFSSVVAQLSPFFAKAVAHYGEYSVQSVFADGLSAMVSTGLSRDGANIYRWGWKAGTLSEQALSEGAAYQGDVLTLFEDNRTRSSALLTMPQALSDPHPVDRVDMWYDFWDDPVYGWSFAVVDAYSAEASTATLNPDGTISPSAEYNKVVNAHDPATWGLLHPARNSFQLLAGP